jgi:hypothetical protein
MLFGFFLTLGVAVFSAGLRSFQNSFAQKAGALGILVTTFLGVYFITSSWVWGFVGAMSWLFLPWLEILTRIRALRLPKEKRLRPKSPPSSDTFPALSEITRELVMLAGIGKTIASFSDCFIARTIGPRLRFVSTNSVTSRFIICAFHRAPKPARFGPRGIIRFPTDSRSLRSFESTDSVRTDPSGSFTKAIGNFCGETE